MKKIIGLFFALSVLVACRQPVHIQIPAGERDTLILNCDTIIYWKKYHPVK